MVAGHHRPAVGQYLDVPPPGVEHRLHGEGHACLDGRTGARAAVVHDMRVVVEDLADAVAAKLLHHREAVGLGMGLDGVADVAECGAGAYGLDAEVEALLGDPHQPFGERLGLADHEHLAGVAMVAVLDDGDVDVEDVAVPELFLAGGDAVADDVVDRGADRAGKRRYAGAGGVVQRRWHAVDLIDDVAVAEVVERIGAHAGLDVRADHLQHAGGQAPGPAHALDVGVGGGFGGHGNLWYKARRLGAMAAPPPKVVRQSGSARPDPAGA